MDVDEGVARSLDLVFLHHEHALRLKFLNIEGLAFPFLRACPGRSSESRQ
jgi:hypothetical protein